MSKKDQPRPITTSYWVDYVSNVVDFLSNASNVVFYSRQQLPVLTSFDDRYNKLIFMAGFGTGKTFLLQEKAIMLSKDDKYKGRILYFVCNGEGLLFHDRKLELSPYGINVVCDYVSGNIITLIITSFRYVHSTQKSPNGSKMNAK